MKREMSIRFLVIGDVHIKKNTIVRSMSMVDAIVKEAGKQHKEQGLDFIVVAGDVLDRFGDARVEAHHLASHFITRLMDITFVYVIMGNHDMPNNSSFLNKMNFFQLLHKCNGVKLIETVVHDTINDVQFSFCPYVPDGRFKEALDTNPGWKESKVIFCHQTFYQAKMGAILSKTGDKWDIDLPIAISGHIHDHNILQENMYYVGTPDQMSFGDSSRKTISIFKLDDGKLSENRVSLNLPKRIHMEIMSSEVPYCVIPQGDKTIKITITGTMAENMAVKKLDIVKEWKARGIVVDYHDILPQQSDNIFIIDDGPRKQRKKFIEGLYDDISNDPDMLETYHEVFGKTQ